MNEDDNSALTLGDLPRVISYVILQGTAEQRQQLAANLVEVQQQLSPEEAPLGRFWDCLVAVLRGETPDVARLVPPFTEFWQKFEERLHVSSDKSSQQEQVNDE